MAGGMRRDYRKPLWGLGGGHEKGNSIRQCHQLSSLQSAPVPHLSSLPTHSTWHSQETWYAWEWVPWIGQRHSNMFGTSLESMSPNSGAMTWCFTPSQPVRLPNLGGSRETAGKKSKPFQVFLVRYKMKRDKLSIVKRNAMMRMIVNITDGIGQQNKLDWGDRLWRV